MQGNVRQLVGSSLASAIQSSGKPEEYHQCAVQSHDILVVKLTDAFAEPCFRHGGYSVDHQPRRNLEPITIGGLDQHTQ
jgi:hypothetical protein